MKSWNKEINKGFFIAKEEFSATYGREEEHNMESDNGFQLPLCFVLLVGKKNLKRGDPSLWQRTSFVCWPTRAFNSS
jgi:hypothetical protein